MQTVILHGGGMTAPETTKRLIACAGGPAAGIVVLAHTGEDVAGKAKRSADWLRENGAQDVQAPVGVSEALAALERATGVWIPGGDQNVLLATFAGTGLAMRLSTKRVIGGTSAGAALMSGLMPTGEGDSKTMRKGSVAVKPGLGALPSAIVDTHFFVRQRTQRLINMVLSSPSPVLGIGVDENAWCEVSPEGVLVVRAGQVALIEAQRLPPNAPLLAGNIKIKILGLGQSQNLSQPLVV
ncbi:cyanophycinase [Armatimonas rosea]|uniref:Cyanophycinase n=1 Tax=Armatimonas rosea TaxID=685828 RepID=A0A7W9W5D0_ARMRO|nr:cyanophycinase [Armatimonas rosea]MBB6048931.1 cyanophycinase [Armatimonas rosea]